MQRRRAAISLARNADGRLCCPLLQLTCCQFHVLFYCSRLLPNVFASIAVNLALAAFCRALQASDAQRQQTAGSWMVAGFAFTCIVLRCDLLMLAAPCIFLLLLTSRLSLVSLITAGSLSSLLSIAVTVSVDSYYWRRLLWPELSVLLYNNPVQGRYEEWGQMPLSFYFTSALPRGLMATALLVPVGLLRSGLPTAETAWRWWQQRQQQGSASLLQLDWTAVQLVSRSADTAQQLNAGPPLVC